MGHLQSSPSLLKMGLVACRTSEAHWPSGTCGRRSNHSAITTNPLAEHFQCAFMAAAASSSALLHLSSLSFGFHTCPKLHSIAFQGRKAPPPSFYKYPISASFSSPNPSSWNSEEQRWLREEQRWLREEQRWIREEQRWNSERASLLREIADLKLRVEALQLEKQMPSAPLLTDTASNLASILQALKESEANLAATVGRIAESGSAARPLLLEEGEAKEMVVEEIKVQQSFGEVKVGEEEEKKKRPSLRMGSEGEVVREMQVRMLQF